ncbi:MAG: hypothetical protein HYU03_06900 [Thaumarchaeota archaeon]|nr:hypothetical protein [Nitrososphaerota archaeon]MBI3116817.1 hypothetical protein [Nitrososphaerota archaeon]MCS4540398.1 hypothetical protein [Nitrososphaerota archaeon]
MDPEACDNWKDFLENNETAQGLNLEYYGTRVDELLERSDPGRRRER